MAKTKKKTTAPADKKKIAGSTFIKKSCHTTKSAAQKVAGSIRAKGYKARVIGGCVYQGPKARRKKAAA